MDAGVVLSSDYGPSGPTYLFTALNDIKPTMIAEATAAGREDAEQFARDANTRIGGLRRANQGVYRVRSRATRTQAKKKPLRCWQRLLAT